MHMINSKPKDISAIKKQLNLLVNKYCSLDAKFDNANRLTIRENIWELLYSYFNTPLIISKINNQFNNLSNYDHEDILSECIFKGYLLIDKYNPKKSKAAFTTFLETSITNFLYDYYKKNKRNWDVVSYDSYSNSEENDNNLSSLESNTALQSNDKYDIEETNFILNSLQEFSNIILDFLSHQGKKYNAVRKLYYCIFYTDTLISLIMSEKSYNEECFPPHILDAYYFPFSDYILIDKCRTPLQIYNSEIHTYNDILENGNEKTIEFPVSAKILISYFDKIENKKVSNANISQFKKEYKELLGDFKILA